MNQEQRPVMDLDLELREGRGGRGIVLLTPPAFLPSVISSLSIQYTGEGSGVPGPLH